MISEELREAGISLVNKADVQEWLTVDRHKPGHTAPMVEDIIEALANQNTKVRRKTSRLSPSRVRYF